MENLYKIVENLCIEKGVNITRMCSESGASRGSLSDLKMGRKQSLSADTLTKIADYFKVSVDYLLGNEEKPTVKNDELEDDELFAFYGDVKKSLTQADKDDIMALIRIRAELNKNKKG